MEKSIDVNFTRFVSEPLFSSQSPMMHRSVSLWGSSSAPLRCLSVFLQLSLQLLFCSLTCRSLADRAAWQQAWRLFPVLLCYRCWCFPDGCRKLFLFSLFGIMPSYGPEYIKRRCWRENEMSRLLELCWKTDPCGIEESVLAIVVTLQNDWHNNTNLL